MVAHSLEYENDFAVYKINEYYETNHVSSLEAMWLKTGWYHLVL